MSLQKPDPARPRRRVTVQSKTPPDNAMEPQKQAPARPAQDDREGWKTH
jgi:hypothetical protein